MNNRILKIFDEPEILFHLLYSILLAFLIIPEITSNSIIKLVFSGLLIINSYFFLRKLFFTPLKKIEYKINSFSGKPEFAIIYLIDESEKWLKDIKKFINIRYNLNGTKKDEKQKIQKLFKTFKVFSFLLILGEIERDKKSKKNYEELGKKILLKESELKFIYRRISESINADQEAIENLLGINITIETRIVREIVMEYDPSKIERRKKNIERKLERLAKLQEKVDYFSDMIEIIRDASTGRAVTRAAKVLQKAENVEDLKWLTRFVNSRIGFQMGELLGLKVEWGMVKWYEKQVIHGKDTNKANFEDVKEFLKSFVNKRKFALDTIWEKFYEWHWEDIKRDIFEAKQPLAIALTYGYSSTLEFILDKMLTIAENDKSSNIRLVQLVLIKSQRYGDEEFLKGELIRKHTKLNCSIMPLDAIRERGLKIGKVLIGIESIGISGDIVHPRGSAEIIKVIKSYAPNAVFYAFGETYKFKEFGKILIDYSKIAFCKHEYIDYVISDHGVHRNYKTLFFEWNNINEKEKIKIKNFIDNNYDIEWMKSANIAKTEDGKILRIFTNINSIEIDLYEEMEKAILRINGSRNYELIAKKENNKLNIYKQSWEIFDNGNWRQTKEYRNPLTAEIIEPGTLYCCLKHWQDRIG